VVVHSNLLIRGTAITAAEIFAATGRETHCGGAANLANRRRDSGAEYGQDPAKQADPAAL
jgi:hypothetical protein